VAIFREEKPCLPVDPEFQKKRKKVGKEQDIAVLGPVDPPEKLDIRGTYVAVDLDACSKTCRVTHAKSSRQTKPLSFI
jgi:hypothetical protein